MGSTPVYPQSPRVSARMRHRERPVFCRPRATSLYTVGQVNVGMGLSNSPFVDQLQSKIGFSNGVEVGGFRARDARTSEPCESVAGGYGVSVEESEFVSRASRHPMEIYREKWLSPINNLLLSSPRLMSICFSIYGPLEINSRI
jgi:hypothetical protein